MSLAWLLLVAGIVSWGWGGLILLAPVAVATVLLLRANSLGSGRSEDDVVIPAIGPRVTRPTRLTPVPLPSNPTDGGDA
jgi:hypothetical protein